MCKSCILAFRFASCFVGSTVIEGFAIWLSKNCNFNVGGWCLHCRMGLRLRTLTLTSRCVSAMNLSIFRIFFFAFLFAIQPAIASFFSFFVFLVDSLRWFSFLRSFFIQSLRIYCHHSEFVGNWQLAALTCKRCRNSSWLMKGYLDTLMNGYLDTRLILSWSRQERFFVKLSNSFLKRSFTLAFPCGTSDHIPNNFSRLAHCGQTWLFSKNP